MWEKQISHIFIVAPMGDYTQYFQSGFCQSLSGIRNLLAESLAITLCHAYELAGGLGARLSEP